LQSLDPPKFIDIPRRADPALCEGILFQLLSKITEGASEYSLRLPSQFGSTFFFDIWASILVGTLCRQRLSPRQVITWGQSEWDPEGQFGKSIPGITSLQLAHEVVTDRPYVKIDISDVEQRITERGLGTLEDEGGKSRTLVEFDPQRPIAAKLEASSSAKQSILFNNLILTFREDVPIAVELRRADVAGMNVTRPS
jgi:hypothetical protein